MVRKIMNWDIYEIKTLSSPITEVMLRGRIRKLCLNNKRNVLVENSEDSKNTVRFAVPSGENISIIKEYLEKILPDVIIKDVGTKIKNPVLSKLRVNLEERYSL